MIVIENDVHVFMYWIWWVAMDM